MPTDTRAAIAKRIRRVRRERFGEDGVPALAEALGVPARTWENYEIGVMVPTHVLLAFLVLTSTRPQWLLTGEGPRLAPDSPP